MFRPFYLTLPLLFTTVPFGGTPNRREFGCKRIAQKNSMPLASQIRWRQKHKQSGNQAVLSINHRFPFFWDTCWFLGNHAHWEPFFLRGEKKQIPKRASFILYSKPPRVASSGRKAPSSGLDFKGATLNKEGRACWTSRQPATGVNVLQVCN